MSALQNAQECYRLQNPVQIGAKDTAAKNGQCIADITDSMLCNWLKTDML